MKTILIPVFKNRISSRLDCTEFFQVVKIDGNRIQYTDKIKIIAKNQLDKLNSIISLKPDTVICNGITEYFECEFLQNNIQVIPWVYGQIEEVVEDFMKGKLLIKKEKIQSIA